MQRARAWIETVLRSYPWAIALAVLIPCAYFAASGANNLFALALFKADVTALTRPAPPSPADTAAQANASPTSHHSRDTHQMLARNVFDADAGCLNCAPPPAEGNEGAPGEPGAEIASGEPEPCDGQAHVTGAVEVDDPLWSFVFISPGGSQPALPYRVGQTVDSKTVASIGWHERYGAFAMLRSGPGGPLCFYAQIMPPRTTPAAPPPPTPTSTGSPGGDALSAALDHGISQTSPTEYSVQRSLIDRILENQAELMRTTRIMPHEENGHVVGVQLFGVRGNSLLGRLGLQNNDVLNRINGLDISSPDRALEAYSRLRTADRITLSVTRNGTPTTLDFNIH